jgi:hypothetical protein
VLGHKSRQWPVSAAAVLLLVGCVTPSSGNGSGDAPDDEVGASGDASDDGTGTDPFAPHLDRDDPAPGMTSELSALVTTAEQAADDAAGGVDPRAAAGPRAVLQARLDAAVAVFTDARVPINRPRSVAGVALAPARDEEACRAEVLTQRLLDEPEVAEAFTEVAGIEADQLAEYLDGLLPGYLIDQALVVNHRYRDDHAVPFRAVLEAGTAVLVDDDGLPRVRCLSAAPLVPAWIEFDEWLLASTSFADRVEEASLGGDVPAAPVDTIDGMLTDDPDEALGPPDEIAVSLGDDTSTGAPSDPDASDPEVTAPGGTTTGGDGTGGDGTGADGVTDGDLPASCRNRVVLELVDNRLVDGEGPDLLVVELSEPEASYVAVGVTADDLRPVGWAGGGVAAVDIAEVAGPGERFAFVQLCDGPDSSTEVPGSDIDAVAAIHTIDPRSP